MKILHILDHSQPYFSGYAFRSNYILINQRLHGLDVVVLTSPKHQKFNGPTEGLDGIKYYRTRMPLQSYGIFTKPFIIESIQMRTMRKRILQVAKEEKIDLIHAHSPSLNGLPACWAAKKLNLPITYEARAFWEDAAVDHGTFSYYSLKYKISRSIETRLFRKVNRIFTICESMKTEILDRGFKPDKLTVIPNGVDTKKFRPLKPDDSLRRKYLLKRKLVIGFIGSFYSYEGVDDLLSLMQLIKEERDNIKLMLVGGGPDFNKIKKLVSDYQLEKSVILTGKIPHDQILKYYALIDVFIYPRKKNRLTELVTPLKPLEAMAMEKIVIGSDVGGIKELIRHRKTGFIFPSENIKKLKKVIDFIVDNPGLCSQIRQNARKEVVENRDWFKITERYLEVYEDLVNSAFPLPLS
jgi:PEP-CTERM/exosortase A-associated glycosyltransferase